MNTRLLVAALAAFCLPTMGTASGASVTPAGCSICTLDAQVWVGGATPFALVNLGTGTPNSRQAITGPIIVPGETFAFPAAGSGVYAGSGCLPSACLIISPFGDATTNYLGAVPGDSGIMISYALPQRKLNLLWGTVGNAPGWRDQIVFVFGDGTTGTVTGDDVIAAGIAFNSNATVEITTTQPFTTAIFTEGGAPSFEFVPSVPVVLFAGTPGTSNCVGVSVSALVQTYGGLNATAAVLGYPSVSALQNAIVGYCG
jgi:hypothetical protein